jgi:hypothetical protein
VAKEFLHGANVVSVPRVDGSQMSVSMCDNWLPY